MSLKLKSIQNRHKGETCYLFGDGPSIQSFNYERFSDHIGISCGMQIFHKDFNCLNVKYYSLIEPYLFYPDCMIWSPRLQYLKEHRIVTNEFRKIIKERRDLTFFIGLSNYLAIQEPNINFVHRILLRGNKHFKDFLLDEFNPFGGSFHSTLSLAVLMGFKRVYLVGFDAFTIEKSPYRWYQKKNKESIGISDSKNFYFDFLDSYQNRIEIVNISDSETRCNVQHQSYQDHTGEPAVHRENIELIDPKRMSMMKERYADI